MKQKQECAGSTVHGAQNIGLLCDSHWETARQHALVLFESSEILACSRPGPLRSSIGSKPLLSSRHVPSSQHVALVCHPPVRDCGAALSRAGWSTGTHSIKLHNGLRFEGRANSRLAPCGHMQRCDSGNHVLHFRHVACYCALTNGLSWHRVATLKNYAIETYV